jgi:replicative DNA helicase
MTGPVFSGGTSGLPEEYFWPDLPSHLAAETGILGEILLDNSAYAKCSELQVEDFLLDSHRRIYEHMGEMLKDGKPVDIVTLANYLAGLSVQTHDGKIREIELVGGVAYLAGLTEGICGGIFLEEYIAIVKEKARLRRIWSICEQAIEKCKEQGETSTAILDFMAHGLKGIRTKKK